MYSFSFCNNYIWTSNGSWIRLLKFNYVSHKFLLLFEVHFIFAHKQDFECNNGWQF